MPRRRTTRAIPEADRERFLHAATEFHRFLIEQQTMLHTGCDDYRALRDMHCKLVETICKVTGEDPPWMKIGPRLMG